MVFERGKNQRTSEHDATGWILYIDKRFFEIVSLNVFNIRMMSPTNAHMGQQRKSDLHHILRIRTLRAQCLDNETAHQDWSIFGVGWTEKSVLIKLLQEARATTAIAMTTDFFAASFHNVPCYRVLEVQHVKDVLGEICVRACAVSQQTFDQDQFPNERFVHLKISN